MTTPSRNELLWMTLGAFVLATIAFVLFVLPVEYGRDPTGFGRLTGLDRLAETPEEPATVMSAPPTIARQYARAYRSDEIVIPLQPAGLPGERYELEYKVRMAEGDSFVYSWSVEGVPSADEFYVDFHGEAPRGADGSKPKVVEYQQISALKGDGLLVAPLAGVHGWYLQNQSDSKATWTLRLSGFYELVPPGEVGNEARITPVAAAAQSGE